MVVSSENDKGVVYLMAAVVLYISDDHEHCGGFREGDLLNCSVPAVSKLCFISLASTQVSNSSMTVHF